MGSDASLPGPDSGRQVDAYRESRDIWDDYNKRQVFEHELIDRKTTWWASAQAILFAAYGVSWDSAANGAQTFRNVVAGAGVAVALVTLVGVLGVIRSKRMSWKDHQAFYAKHKDYLPLPVRTSQLQLQWGVRTRNTWFTLGPDILQPFIFLVAWVALLICLGLVKK